MVLGQGLHRLLGIAVLQENHGMSWESVASLGRALHLLCLLCTKDTARSKGKGSKLSARAALHQ